jgi:hypothetical protein
MTDLEEKLREMLEEFDIDYEEGTSLVDTVRDHVEFTEEAIKE